MTKTHSPEQQNIKRFISNLYELRYPVIWYLVLTSFVEQILREYFCTNFRFLNVNMCLMIAWMSMNTLVVNIHLAYNLSSFFLLNIYNVYIVNTRSFVLKIKHTSSKLWHVLLLGKLVGTIRKKIYRILFWCRLWYDRYNPILL